MNYKESSLTGTSWVRCRTVTITNPLPAPEGAGLIEAAAAVPRAFFQEEKVIAIDGVNSVVDAGACSQAFAPAELIPLRDPDTGALTGASVSQGELYVILYSLYMQTAIDRDAAT